MTDIERIQELLPIARAKVAADRGGTMDGRWEIIFDGEALINGRRSLLKAPDLRRLLEELCTPTT